MIKTTLSRLKDTNYLQNKSFNRLRIALESIDTLENSVAYNVIDSVIIIKNPNHLMELSGYKAIYNTILINTSDNELKFAIGDQLNELIEYDDCQDFGIAQSDVVDSIKKDEVAIIETMEPYKIISSKNFILAYVSKYNGIK